MAHGITSHCPQLFLQSRAQNSEAYDAEHNCDVSVDNEGWDKLGDYASFEDDV